MIELVLFVFPLFFTPCKIYDDPSAETDSRMSTESDPRTRTQRKEKGRPLAPSQSGQHFEIPREATASPRPRRGSIPIQIESSTSGTITPARRSSPSRRHTPPLEYYSAAPLTRPPTPIQRMAAKPVKINTKNLEFSGLKADFRPWKDVIELYMIANPDQFMMSKAKIAFALSWMAGTNRARVWASNVQAQYQALPTWPNWATFEAKLEEEYGDPAAESQAQEFLLTYKQGKKKPREFLNELELWFWLAKITDNRHRLHATTRAMDPSMVEALTIAGYPISGIVEDTGMQ